MVGLKAFLGLVAILGLGAVVHAVVFPDGPLGRLASAPTEAALAPAPGTKVVYQYVDDAGAVQLVDTLEEVPLDKRDRMGRMEIPLAGKRRVTAAGGAAEPEVVLFTTSWCPHCSRAMRDLNRMGVRYTNRDIERDESAREAMHDLVGPGGVPVIVINGTAMRGYDAPRVARLIEEAREG